MRGGCAPFSLHHCLLNEPPNSAEVQRRILLGTYATSSDAISHLHGKAMAVRRRVTRDFADAFAIADVLLTPTGERIFTLASWFDSEQPCHPAPNAAPLLSDVAQLSAANAYASDVMTVPASLAGLPALSLPSGCDPLSGMPAISTCCTKVTDRPCGAQVCHLAFSSYPPEEVKVCDGLSVWHRGLRFPLTASNRTAGLLLQCASDLERGLESAG